MSENDRDHRDRLIRLEVKVNTICNLTTSMDKKLDEIMPAVRENSWWIEKIKWGFVFTAIVGVIGGIVTWLMKDAIRP